MKAKALAYQKTDTDLATIQICERYAVQSALDYEHAGEILRGIKALKRRIEDHYARIMKPLNAARKVILDMQTADLTPVKRASDALAAQLLLWEVSERERVKASLAEARAAAEAERETAVATLRELGATHEADRVAKSPVILLPVSSPDIPKVEGLSKTVRYSAEVTDFAALVTAVATGTVPLDALKPNLTFLNERARALKHELRYPGVAVTEIESYVGR